MRKAVTYGIFALIMIMSIPAFFGFLAVVVNLGDHGEIDKLCKGALVMVPEVLLFIALGKVNTFGRSGFFAKLPPEITRRHFWCGTGIGLDTEKNVLFLNNGRAFGRYDLGAIKSIEIRSASGGEIFYSGNQLSTNIGVGTHNFVNVIENGDASGLFFTMRDLDHPIWQVKFGSGKEMKHWYAIFDQMIGN